jgi:transposase
MDTRKPYPSDVSDEEWEFVAPYLTLLPLDAEQRRHDLREVFNALRWLVRSGAHWRMLPHDLPPWAAVYQQTQRWFKAGCFEAMAHDLRMLLRLAAGREPAPTAAVMDSRTLQSTPESGERAGYDGAKRRKGSKVHMAVDTLGHLLTLHVTAADEQDRAQVEQLAQAFSRSRAITSKSPSWTKDIRARLPSTRPPDMELTCWWSSTLKRKKDLYCCRVAGWSNAALAGLHGFADWHAIMSASLKPWRDCTMSLSFASCSVKQFLSSLQVHNRL